MKSYHFALLFMLLLAACQTAPATSVPTPATPLAATPKPASKSTSVPTVTPTPAGPAVHSSSSDPNAANLLVVKDQFIVNNSLTIETLTSARAGFLVLYYDKAKQGRHNLGGIIMFAPVPAGKSNQLVVPLNQNLNPSVNLANLPGIQVDLALQTNASNPNSIVQDNGKQVWVTIKILTKSQSSIFATATP